MQNPLVQTEEQRAIIESVRRFMEAEVAPRQLELDQKEHPEDCFSWEIVEAAHNVGLRTMTLSEKYGGLEPDSITIAMVIEEMARGDMGVAATLGQTNKLAKFMENALNDEQKERVLVPFVEDPRGLLAVGITEPDNGSNYLVPHPVPFRTAAKKADGGWIVNGMKHFISNGDVASYALFFAQTDKDKPLAEGSTCFLVERGREGFTTGGVSNKMGERLSVNAELVFQDCFIPDENLVGELNQGFQIIKKFMPSSNAYAASFALGGAVAAYEKSLEWAKTRIQGGKPIIEHDGVRKMLVEMYMLIDASRAYAHRSAWLADNQDAGWEAPLGVLPKIMATEAAWKVVTMAMDIHGGSGYMKEIGLEKIVRDVAAYHHSDGTNNTLYLKAANLMYQN